MPVNRNALIRYKTIDKCLQNRFRKWTLEDLIDACSDALYEYEGIDKGISRRTVQGDIQMMRSDKLGYNAPIVVVDKKYYAYEDPKYSITNIPLSNQDLLQLNEAVDFLKQFKGFSHFKDLDSMVQKLEDHVFSQKNHRKPVIDFEKNENLKGLEFLDRIHKAILNRTPILLTYQSFKARTPNSFDFHPYLLKEFRNRWFVVGVKSRKGEVLNLALDRIVDMQGSDVEYINPIKFDAEEYFKYTIGVSVNPKEGPENVELYVLNRHAPYVKTKPMHWSQEIIAEDPYGITISLKVQHNFELEKDILGFGDGIKVIKPQKLKRSIQQRLQEGLDLYNTELSDSSLHSMPKILQHKGSLVVNQVYTSKETRRITNFLEKALTEKEKSIAKRTLLKDHPELANYLFNSNIKRIVKAIEKQSDSKKNYFLTRAIYFNKVKDKDMNWFVNWHQDKPINIRKKVETKGFNQWTEKDGIVGVCPPEELLKNSFTIRIHLDETNASNGALKVLKGSHHQYMSDDEIRTITQNSIPDLVEVDKGGIHVMHPLLLHASSKTLNKKKRRVVHLEFSQETLPGKLEWLERLEIK